MSFLVFAGVRATTDPTAKQRFNKDPGAIPRLREKLHLNEPIVKQYSRWASNLVHKKSSFPFVRIDLGTQDTGSNEKVTTVISRGLSNTFELILWGMVFAGLIGISLELSLQ